MPVGQRQRRQRQPQRRARHQRRRQAVGAADRERDGPAAVQHPVAEVARETLGRPALAADVERDRLALRRPLARQRRVVLDLDDIDRQVPPRPRHVVVAQRRDVPVAQLADREDDDLQRATLPLQRAVEGVGLLQRSPRAGRRASRAAPRSTGSRDRRTRAPGDRRRESRTRRSRAASSARCRSPPGRADTGRAPSAPGRRPPRWRRPDDRCAR